MPDGNLQLATAFVASAAATATSAGANPASTAGVAVLPHVASGDSRCCASCTCQWLRSVEGSTAAGFCRFIIQPAPSLRCTGVRTVAALPSRPVWKLQLPGALISPRFATTWSVCASRDSVHLTASLLLWLVTWQCTRI